MNISVDSLDNYKKLTTLIPEIQNLVDDKIPKSVASGIISRLSSAEQEELLQSLPTTQKLTQKQVQEYIDKLNEKDNIISGYEIKMQNLSKQQSEKYQAFLMRDKKYYIV